MFKELIILSVLFLLEIVYLKIAEAKGIIDKPNHRSAHVNPTIRGGGIIYLPALIMFMVFFGENRMTYLPLIISVFVVATISFIDDINPLPAKVRISIHFLAFIFVFYHLGFFNNISIWSIILLFLTFVFSLGYLNIYNFMDGVNGMTFLNALATFGGFLMINECVIIFTDSNLLWVYLLATVVFGFFNFRYKPKCFLGDVGSIALGFSIIYFSVQLFLKTQNYFIILMLGVYLLDGGWTIVERLVRKENVFEAHRRHLYQQFANELKVSHLKISISYFVMQLLLNSIVYCMLDVKYNNILVVFVLFGVCSFAYFYLKKKTYEKVKKLNSNAV